MEERLRVAKRRRQPGRLLHFERELAAGRQVGARRDDDQLATAGQRGGDRLRLPCLLRARVEERADHGRVGLAALTGEGGSDRHAGEDRGQVPDRVAPAAVDLGGLEHQRTERPDRCRAAHRDRRHPRASCRGGPQRRQRRAGGALVADPDDQPPALGRQRRLECLAGHDGSRLAGAGDAGTFRGIGDDRRERHRAVLARAAPRDHDRLAGLEGSPDRHREAACGGVAARRLELRRNARHTRAAPHDAEAAEHAAGQRRLDRDHLGHPPRRAVAMRRSGKRGPRRGRAGERRLRVGMGEDARVEWRRQLHGADDRLDSGGRGLEAGDAGRELARRRAAGS